MSWREGITRKRWDEGEVEIMASKEPNECHSPRISEEMALYTIEEETLRSNLKHSSEKHETWAVDEITQNGYFTTYHEYIIESHVKTVSWGIKSSKSEESMYLNRVLSWKSRKSRSTRSLLNKDKYVTRAPQSLRTPFFMVRSTSTFWKFVWSMIWCQSIHWWLLQKSLAARVQEFSQKIRNEKFLCWNVAMKLMCTYRKSCGAQPMLWK